MAATLYFVAGLSKVQVSDAKIAELGLGYALGEKHVANDVASGPGGVSGVVLSAAIEQLGYYPDAQTWRKLSALDSPPSALWFGFFHDHRRPTPADLARKKQLAGLAVELADKEEWIVPLARSYQIGTGAGGEPTLAFEPALPRAWDLDEAGQWQSRGPVSEYARLWDLACEWFEQRLALARAVQDARDEGEEPEEGQVNWTLAQAIDAACEVLAVNYRLGKQEAAALGLLSDTAVRSVLDAACDFATLLKYEQKKSAWDAAGGSTAPGASG